MNGVRDDRATEPATSRPYYQTSQRLETQPMSYQQNYTSSISTTYPDMALPPSIQAIVNAQTTAWNKEMRPYTVYNSSIPRTATSNNYPRHHQEDAPQESSQAASVLDTPHYLDVTQGIFNTPFTISSDSWYSSNTQPYALHESDEASFWQTSFGDELSSEAVRLDNSPSNNNEAARHDSASFVSSNSRDMPLYSTQTADSSGDIKCPICGMVMHGEYAKGNLKRHKKTRHSETILHCEVEGCSRHYRRSDARTHHYRKSHPELQLPPSVSRTSI